MLSATGGHVALLGSGRTRHESNLAAAIVVVARLRFRGGDDDPLSHHPKVDEASSHGHSTAFSEVEVVVQLGAFAREADDEDRRAGEGAMVDFAELQRRMVERGRPSRKSYPHRVRAALFTFGDRAERAVSVPPDGNEGREEEQGGYPQQPIQRAAAGGVAPHAVPVAAGSASTLTNDQNRLLSAWSRWNDRGVVICTKWRRVASIVIGAV